MSTLIDHMGLKVGQHIQVRHAYDPFRVTIHEGLVRSVDTYRPFTVYLEGDAMYYETVDTAQASVTITLLADAADVKLDLLSHDLGLEP